MRSAGPTSRAVEARRKTSTIFSARLRSLALVAIAALIAPGMLAAPAASAGTCGGDVACQCGDTVQGVAVLQSDIGICSGQHGLVMSTGSVLDCAGHAITGDDPASGEWYGIVLESVTGVQVRNCRVVTFRRGLRVLGGGGHVLSGNELDTNKYGIDLAGQTSGNRIESNVVRDSRDEGIHVGTGAADNVIVGNQVLGSKTENVYLLEATGTRVIGNVLLDAGNAGVFIKHSTNSVVTDNIVWNTGIQLRGDSSGNVLANNDLRGDGYLFEAFLDDRGWTFPHDNQVSGGTVFNAKECVRMLGAHDNTVQGVKIEDDCMPAFSEAPEGGRTPSGNVFDLTVVDPGTVGSHTGVQVTANTRQVRAGDVLTLGLAVHNNAAPDVPLGLYVGVLLPDGQVLFFTSDGSGPSTSMAPFAAAPTGFTRALPRVVDLVLPPGIPPGTYQFFGALVRQDALADGTIAPGEVPAADLEPFAIVP